MFLRFSPIWGLGGHNDPKSPFWGLSTGGVDRSAIALLYFSGSPILGARGQSSPQFGGLGGQKAPKSPFWGLSTGGVDRLKRWKDITGDANTMNLRT
ncbi:hypothetical protein AWQ21_15100 (plasmid) [Picosynechococcus sp. PCC 7003]|nr:hypothetical protein AWQ21_15100 [Picosynechococcus sp. PCC 7003]